MPILEMLVVSRIVVIGNSVGDKSTLSLRLANRRDLPLFDSDYLLRKDPGRRPTLPAVYAREHAEIIAQECWIFDGLDHLLAIPDVAMFETLIQNARQFAARSRVHSAPLGGSMQE
jgi:hypothetical protein